MIFARSLRELNFAELMRVYEESNLQESLQKYPLMDVNFAILEVEQDFYCFLQHFFREQNTVYAILCDNHFQYLSALRAEPFLDGMLLEALETRPQYRRSGYASALLKNVIDNFKGSGVTKIYSHVNKKNTASLHVHLKHSFQIIKDHAVYIDGSVCHNTYTLVREL